jgi:DNA-binding response OmpR family regulator
MTTPGRLLLVDDEVPVLDLLADYFVERGYAVTAVASGQKALAAFTRERPDAVLLDIRMSGVDGVAVLKRLHEADPDVPVIMVTANEDESLARDTLAIGAFDYVAKPFDFEHLDRTVAAALLYSARAPVRGMPDRPRPDDRWSLLVSDVFRVVRRMAPEGRASTGVRLEDTALIAAQYAIGGRLADAAQALAELDFLVGVASRLGDLSASGRSVLDNALKTAQAGLPQR